RSLSRTAVQRVYGCGLSPRATGGGVVRYTQERLTGIGSWRRLAGVAALALVALALPAGARAATGFVSTAVPLTVTVGARTGSVTLARTSFAPSYGVAGAPDPQIDWGDGTTSTPTVPDVGSCI